jgi:predicted transcriptional regulator
MHHLKQAVAIFAEIGSAESDGQNGARAGVYTPEIWKLAEW